MRVFFQFLKPYRRICLLTVLVMAVDVAGALFLPTLVADMINIGVAGGDMRFILEKGVLMLAVALISGGGTLMGSFLCARLSARIGRDIRNALYDRSLQFSAYDFEQFGTGSMITRTLSDVNVVQQAFVWSIQMVLPVPLMCVTGVIMAFSIDRAMGFLLVGVTAVVIAAAIFFTRRASAIFERMQSFLDKINRIVRENITGVRVIRAFNKEKSEEERMHRSFEDYAEASIKASTLFFMLDSLAFFVINICIVTILWLGGNRIGAGYMEIGDITALTEYAILILFYVIMAQMVIMLLPRANVCLRRIGEVLSRQPEIADGMGKATDVSENQTGGPGKKTGRLEKRTGGPEPAGENGACGASVCTFEDVDFRFPDADEATLQHISFSMGRGETTAIIGSTGSGKSTIAKLILRFHDVSGGRLLFEGRDVRGMSQKELRDHIAYVPQKAWLFSGTIADNLRCGDEGADEAAMERALSVAQADFVRELPKGLASRVSQGGSNFSGGQRQRLSIARALMRKADLYIFDDSFSALDFKTDAALRRALAREVKDSAVLIIAQRVGTIMNADRIIVLEDGCIAGIGRHEELLLSCPVYREIADSQMKGGGFSGK